MLTQRVVWQDLDVSTDDDDAAAAVVVGDDDGGGGGQMAAELTMAGWGDRDDRVVESACYFDAHSPMDQDDDAAAHYVPYWHMFEQPLSPQVAHVRSTTAPHWIVHG